MKIYITLVFALISSVTLANEVQINNHSYVLKTLYTASTANTNTKNSTDKDDLYGLVEVNKFPNGIVTSQVYENGLENYTNRIVINTSSNEEALITGKLMVWFKGMSPEEVATKYNITLTSSFPHLNLAFYAPNQQDLFIVRDALTNDDAIEKVSIELIKHLYYSH